MMDGQSMVTRIALVLLFLNFIIAELRDRNIQWQIPIGIIQDRRDEVTFTGFYYSVQILKQIETQTFELHTPVEYVDKSDSYKLAQAICTSMSNGVFALFGTKSYRSQDILTSYSDKFHMPYITISSILESTQGKYEVHMKPPLTRILRDLIFAKKWKNIFYVYDSDAGLMRYQELRELLLQNNTDQPVHIKIRRIQNIKQAHDDLKSLDSQELRSTTKQILIDLESEESYAVILQQIREVGMNKQNYSYILATQDILSLPVEKFRHGGVKITGFQLVDYSTYKVHRFIGQWKTLSTSLWPGAGGNRISVGAALSFDAATILQDTIKGMLESDPNVFKTTFRRADIYNFNTTKGIPCSGGRPWMHGQEIMRRMKSMDFDGLTGRVTFDENGMRRHFNLEVYQVSLDFGPTKIGDWHSVNGFTWKGQEEKYEEKIDNIDRDIKIVISVLEKPFFMLKSEPQKNGSAWTGNDRYEGFSVELIREVASIADFKYKLKHSTTGVYGTYLNENQSWNGLIGRIIRKEVDISIAPLTITRHREEYVDFSEPFMNTGISIMIKKPDIQKPGVFAFMQPFSIFLWLCIVISYFVVSVGIFLVGRFSPSEWEWSKPFKLGNNKFNLASSFWFTMGSMMLQGSDTCPRSNAGRIVGGAWWFVVLITISSYTANLAAFLTIEKLLTPIEGVDDLAKQTEIAYGTLASGSTQDFFRNSEVPVYQAMWNYMTSAQPTGFVDSSKEGVERVRNMKGKYAFLMESVYNEYFNHQEPCDTMQVGPNLNSKGYGIATWKRSGLRDQISIAVLKLKENGMLIKLKNQWWIEKGGCGVQETHSKSKKRSLSLNKVAGVFFILIGGLVFAIVVGVIHFHKTKTKVQKLGGLYFFGNDMKCTANIEYTRCPTESTNGRVVTNGRSNGEKPQAGWHENDELGVPNLDHHVCQSIDNSVHRNRHEPVQRLSAKKKS
ncbi:glutamate receptor 2-like [Mytilus edulis]|uniref:glutamate receptor 2-like n=1 Tax=Mytilus edulis TaxID=6550 RepID=UPI0039F05DD9